MQTSPLAYLRRGLGGRLGQPREPVPESATEQGTYTARRRTGKKAVKASVRGSELRELPTRAALKGDAPFGCSSGGSNFILNGLIG